MYQVEYTHPWDAQGRWTAAPPKETWYTGSAMHDHPGATFATKEEAEAFEKELRTEFDSLLVMKDAKTRISETAVATA